MWDSIPGLGSCPKPKANTQLLSFAGVPHKLLIFFPWEHIGCPLFCYINVKISLSVSNKKIKKLAEILFAIALNLQDDLRITDILTILNLLISEYGIFHYFFGSPLISQQCFLDLSEEVSHIFVKFIPRWVPEWLSG